MTKLILTSGNEVETTLTFQSIQALIKNGNLVITTSGEYINPHTIERVVSAPQAPIMNYRIDNFHVPTDEEQKAAQAKLQPMKAMFEQRAQLDKELLGAQRAAYNSQSIYGAEKTAKTTETPLISKEIPESKKPAAITRMKRKK